MTNFRGNGRIVTPYKNSKLGQQNFISSARVGMLFTFNQEYGTDIDEQSGTFLDATDESNNGFFDNGSVGGGQGAGGRALIPRVGGTNTGNPRELLVGAGWRSVNVEQQINVTQEGGLGFFDIMETIDHNVASNSLTCDKLALRTYLLSQSGLAPFGKDVLTSPRLNCYIYDPKERQRGYNVGYLKLFGLHIQTNRFSANTGSPVMENVTFRADRIQRVTDIPTAVLQQLVKQFPTLYTNVEQLEQFDLPDISAML